MNLFPNEQNLERSDDKNFGLSQSGSSSIKKPSPPPISADSGKDVEGQVGFGGGLRVSLMPSGEEEGVRSQRRWLIILLATLLIETAAIGAGYLFLINREEATKERRMTLERTIGEITAGISEAESKAREASQLGTKARTAKTILDSHLHWTNVFVHLASQTKPGITYLNFSGDAQGKTIVMDAVGTNYREVAEQIVALREDPAVKSVVTTSAAAMTTTSGEITGISFSLLLTLEPEVWLTRDGTGQNSE